MSEWFILAGRIKLLVESFDSVFVSMLLDCDLRLTDRESVLLIRFTFELLSKLLPDTELASDSEIGSLSSDFFFLKQWENAKVLKSLEEEENNFDEN